MPRYRTIHFMSSRKKRRMRSALLNSFHESCVPVHDYNNVLSIMPPAPENDAIFNDDYSDDIEVTSGSSCNNNYNDQLIQSNSNEHIHHQIPDIITSTNNHCQIFSHQPENVLPSTSLFHDLRQCF